MFAQTCNKHERETRRFIRNRSRSAIMLHLHRPGPAAVNTVIPSHPSDFISFSASVSTPQISPPHNRQLSALCCRQLHCGAIRLRIAPYVSLLLYLSPASDYISRRPAFSPPLGIVPASPPCCHAELRTLLLSYR